MGTPAFAPCDIVVFGGTGDLTVRKLLPALYQRHRDGQLPDGTRVIACSRAGLDDAGYRDKIRGELPRFVPAADLEDHSAEAFIELLEHVSLDVEDDHSWAGLTAKLPPADDSDRVRVFYLACAPSLFGTISAGLDQHGLIDEQSRVVLEKPLGTDLASSREINDAVAAAFPRGADLPHRPLSRQGNGPEPARAALRQFGDVRAAVELAHIDHVQITSPRPSGSRAAAIITTAPARCATWSRTICCSCSRWWRWSRRPTSTRPRCATRRSRCCARCADHGRRRRDRRHRPISRGASMASRCPAMPRNRPRQNQTETFVALKAHVDNWRWKGVPFYLRTGKRMPERETEIFIQFNACRIRSSPRAGRRPSPTS
jgi:glucose-6-phosphate 1-dehydrogenase